MEQCHTAGFSQLAESREIKNCHGFKLKYLEVDIQCRKYATCGKESPRNWRGPPQSFACLCGHGFYQLDNLGHIWEDKISIEELPPLDWPVGMPVPTDILLIAFGNQLLAGCPGRYEKSKRFSPWSGDHFSLFSASAPAPQFLPRVPALAFFSGKL